MKQIAEFHTSQQADTLALLLNSHGIVTHVSSQTNKVLGGLSYGVVKVGVYAVLDHQYDDAVALMADSNHTVTTGLSPQELAEFEEHAQAAVFSSMNKAIVAGLILIAFMVWLMIEVASAA